MESDQVALRLLHRTEQGHVPAEQQDGVERAEPPRDLPDRERVDVV
jgi:hypothetical protein